MAEVMDEARYVPHHPKKIALVLSAMRHFAQELRGDGWQVEYTRLDDPDAGPSIVDELMRRAEMHGAREVLATIPGEWRLIAALEDAPLKVTLLPDDRFLLSPAEFSTWAEGRKELRMEYFYREMRRKTGYLMEGDKPAGGKWNFDHDNRKPARADTLRAAPMQFTPDEITEEVLDLVEARFGDNFGTLRPFWFAVATGQAKRALGHFAKHLLAEFGDYQDAMLTGDKFLHHSVFSPYLNIGLLDPVDICTRVVEEWQAGRVPINAAEGYIRYEPVCRWRDHRQKTLCVLRQLHQQDVRLLRGLHLFGQGKDRQRCLSVQPVILGFPAPSPGSFCQKSAYGPDLSHLGQDGGGPQSRRA